MNDQDIQKIIDRLRQLNVFSSGYHQHNGTNSLVIPSSHITLFTALVADATIAPEDTPVDGTQRVLYDGTNYYFWIRANQLWKHVVLS